MSSMAEVAQSTPYPGLDDSAVTVAAADLLAYVAATSDPNADAQANAALNRFQADMGKPVLGIIQNFNQWNNGLPVDTSPLDLTTRTAQAAVVGWPSYKLYEQFVSMAQRLDQPFDGLNQRMGLLAPAPAPPPIPPSHPSAPPPRPQQGPPPPGTIRIGPGGFVQLGPPPPTPPKAPLGTGSKVAIGAGAVAGTGFLALLWYSVSHGLTLVQGAQALIEGGKFVKKTIRRNPVRRYRRIR